MKNRLNIKTWCLLFILLLPISAIAANSAADNLNTQLAKITSLTANFQQQVLNDDGSPLQASTGSIAILRPGKFRWVTTDPLKQIIVTDGKTLWIYEPDLEQVTVRTLSNNIGQTPLLLLTQKNIVLQNNFFVKALNVQQASQSYELSPKFHDDSFKKITIVFNQGRISSMTLLNQLGQTTVITFNNVIINPAISVKQFSFTVPPHVDVVNMSDGYGQ